MTVLMHRAGGALSSDCFVNSLNMVVHEIVFIDRQACVSHSVHNRPYGYLVTIHPYYGVVGSHPTGMLSYFQVQSKLSV